MHQSREVDPSPAPEATFTRRIDRFAATLCFLLAAFALAVVAFGVIDFARGCPGSRHGCPGIGFVSFLGIALIAVAGGLWLWPRRPDAPKRENGRS